VLQVRLPAHPSWKHFAADHARPTRWLPARTEVGIFARDWPWRKADENCGRPFFAGNDGPQPPSTCDINRCRRRAPSKKFAPSRSKLQLVVERPAVESVVGGRPRSPSAGRARSGSGRRARDSRLGRIDCPPAPGPVPPTISLAECSVRELLPDQARQGMVQSTGPRAMTDDEKRTGVGPEARSLAKRSLTSRRQFPRPPTARLCQLPACVNKPPVVSSPFFVPTVLA